MSSFQPADVTIEDVRQLLFDLWMVQRENAALRAANAELKHLLDQAAPLGDVAHGDGG